jgi:hypothetical protein
MLFKPDKSRFLRARCHLPWMSRECRLSTSRDLKPTFAPSYWLTDPKFLQELLVLV